MKNKILIGSILAVVLMVLASCSTVIGAENVKERPEVEEKNVEKIEQMVESIKEKVNINGFSDPDTAQPTCILTLWFLYLWYLWVKGGCPLPSRLW